MLTLRELSEDDAGAFVAESVASLVDDLVHSAVVSGADRDAATLATGDYIRRLLPDGVQSEGHRFTSIDVEGRRVGRLWFVRFERLRATTTCSTSMSTRASADGVLGVWRWRS